MSRYFLATLSCAVHPERPKISAGLAYIKGQKECGEGGFEHWQFCVVTHKKCRPSALQKFWRGGHYEATRSSAALDYVQKEETRVEGTQFEEGVMPTGRPGKDWAAIRRAAVENRFGDIPDDVFVRNYGSLRRIATDYMVPEAVCRRVTVYWGLTGVGKSHRAWEEAGLDSYPKPPTTKFWDGYRGHKNVVIDEFRGNIEVSHLLRWFDKYPVIVEVKGGAVVLKAESIWITSNLHPSEWYPTLDQPTKDALMRRLKIVEIIKPF